MNMRYVYILLLFLSLLFAGVKTKEMYNDSPPASTEAASSQENSQPAQSVNATQQYKVVSIKNGKSFTLETGDMVRLASIQVPNVQEEGERGRPGEPLGNEAKATLSALILNKKITLKFVGETTTPYRDRHGRLVAQVYGENGSWIQGEMLKAGMAMVYSFPDEREQVEAMLPLEREARAAKRGIWADPYFAVIPVEKAAQYVDRFKLVEGKVVNVSRKTGMLFINFGEDWKTDFTLFAGKGTAKYFKKFDAESLAGKTIRARGWIYEKNGASIDLTHPEQIEVLE